MFIVLLTFCMILNKDTLLKEQKTNKHTPYIIRELLFNKKTERRSQ